MLYLGKISISVNGIFFLSNDTLGPNEHFCGGGKHYLSDIKGRGIDAKKLSGLPK